MNEIKKNKLECNYCLQHQVVKLRESTSISVQNVESSSD